MEKIKSNSENNQNIINKKSESLFSTSNLPIITEKGESSAENSAKRDSTSRQLNFDDPTEDALSKKAPDRPKISLFSKIQSNESTKKSNEAVNTRLSDASWKTKTNEIKNSDSLIAPIEALSVSKAISAPTKSSESMLLEHKLCTELQTPKVKSNINESTNTAQKPNADDETPYKTFQVPQTATMRRVQSSSQHRTLLSSASQPRKCRTELENEFRSQKVLFTTPSAVSRPAMKVMNHLGLDDSLNCYKSSPMTNLSPVKEERKENKYSSIEDLYRSIDKTDAAKSDASNKEEEAKANANVATTATSECEDKNDKKEKIISINGKDFVVQSKIGQGGSSSVFLVEHKDTKLQCALKVVQHMT